MSVIHQKINIVVQLFDSIERIELLIVQRVGILNFRLLQKKNLSWFVNCMLLWFKLFVFLILVVSQTFIKFFLKFVLVVYWNETEKF